MYIILQKVFAVVLAVECFVGITINVFISALQIRKWKAVKSLDSCDQILLWLGISRSLFLTNSSLEFVMQAYFPWTLQNFIFYSAIWLLRNLLYSTSFWLTALLCVVYCVKIANYNNPVFLYMKIRISKLIPRLIVASLLISLAFTFPLIFLDFHSYWESSVNHFVGNATMSTASFFQNYPIRSIIYILGSSLPFLIFCSAVSLLIQSLWLHTRQIRRSSGTSFQSPKLEAHFSVVKSMILFLCCQIIHFGCLMTWISVNIYVASTWKVLFAIVICAPPCLHSLYMVYSNNKLKQALIEMCCGLQRSI